MVGGIDAMLKTLNRDYIKKYREIAWNIILDNRLLTVVASV
jgi:hypothetical protein